MPAAVAHPLPTASTSTTRSRRANALTGSGCSKPIRIVLSYLAAQLRPNPVEENFEQWVTNRFGKRLYEIFFKTYTEKVWGIPVHRDPRRVGGAAHPGPLAGQGDPLGRGAQPSARPSIKTLINEFQYPAPRPRARCGRCARDRIVRAWAARC